MKTSFKLLLFSVFVVVSNSLFSQDSRFIEVTTADTINLKPTEFTYQVSLKAKVEYKSYSYTSYDTTPSVSASYVENLLKLSKFNWKMQDNSNYTIDNSATNDTNLLVVLTNEQDLKKLYKLLLPLKGISAKIFDTKYESIATYNNNMYKNLYQKALNEATTLATVSGSVIGKLISADEIKDSNSDYMSLYEVILKELPYFNKNSGLNKVIIKKMSFKFQIQ